MKKIALVYDRLNKLGGAEVILHHLHQLWPQAPWYTSVYQPQKLPFTQSWQVKTSFLQSLPWLRNHHELVPYLMPFAFESFDFSPYDLVISVSSAEAKGIITQPKTFHLHYCLTPTRYLWSHADQYLHDNQFSQIKKLGQPLIKKIHHWLQDWDLIASTRPDAILAISHHVRKRIKKYYNRDAEVVYPPVEINKFTRKTDPPLEANQGYYLSVARLVPYKKIDLLVQAFNHRSHDRLIIIGDGVERRRLQRLASPNIIFKGFVSESELISYYQHAQAFLQANEEDFGIAMVEAQAAGIPVVAYAEGGAREIISSPDFGLLFHQPTTSSLLQALDKLETMKFSKLKLRQNARRFSASKFKTKFKQKVEVLWQTYQNQLKITSM